MPFYFLAFSRNLGQSINIFEITFGSLFIFYFIKKGFNSLLHLISLYVISLPIINLTKGSFFSYNIHSIILFIIIFKAYQTFPEYFIKLKNNKLFIFFIIFSIIYYLASFLNTSDYSSNFRIFELILMATIFPLILENKNIFKNMILGLSFNSILIMQVVISLGAERLMIDKSEFEGLEIGGSNPIGFGLPIAFCILMILTNGERIVFNKKINRAILLALLAICLILTTSRGSILVVLVGIGVYYITENKLISLLKLIIIPFSIFFTLYLLKDVDKNFNFSYKFLIERSSDNSNNLNKISSGRSEQWDAVFSHLSNYPSDLIVGFGPGNQKEAHQYISYSTQDKYNSIMIGKKIAYHALSLQLIVEIGIVGAIVFYLIFFSLFYRSIKYYKLKKDILPIIGTAGFFIIGLSVSSFDPYSGMFLGTSFIPLVKLS
jgi:O-antigen ligase